MEYDGWAERYDEDTGRFGWQAPSVVLNAVATAGAAPRDVLDLGVGTGQCSAPLAREGAKVIGVDASAAMLEQARASGYCAELHLLQLGAQTLQSVLGEARFDLTVSCGVMHFVEPLDTVCSEVFATLRPGGLFAFTLIPPQARSFANATHLRSSADVDPILRRAGFSVQPSERFIAYYAQGDRSSPVLYELWLARRPA